MASRGHRERARAGRHHRSAASWCRYGVLLGRLLPRDWNLRWLRVAQGLSQERLAHAAGIDRASVGRVGRGSEHVTISILEAMARALPVAHLLVEPDGEGGRPASLKAGRKPAQHPRAHRMARSAAVRRLRSARISRSSRQGLVSPDAGPGACTLSSTRSLRTSARRVQAGMARIT